FLLLNAFLLSSVEMHAQYAEDSPENTENESNIIYETNELNEEYDEYENSEDFDNSMPDVEVVSDYKKINSYFIDTFFTTDRTPFDSQLREKYHSKDYDYEFGKDGQNYFNNLKDWISNLIAEFFDINDSKEIDTISNYI